ncbi:hypothetical protein QW180_18635 [Vibrio sinaloensis]|nr:hypothetical protein [Vibrio sinaloensis]
MRRFIVVTPIAILLSFIVFVAMAWLVRTPSMTAEAVAVESVDFIVSEQEDQLVRRTRSLPEPKETLPEPQVSDTITSPKSHVSEPHRALSALPIGNVEVEVANTNVSVANIAPVNYSQQANLSVQVSSSQQAMPLYRVEPFFIQPKHVKEELKVTLLFDSTLMRAALRWRWRLLKRNPSVYSNVKHLRR